MTRQIRKMSGNLTRSESCFFSLLHNKERLSACFRLLHNYFPLDILSTSHRTMRDTIMKRRTMIRLMILAMSFGNFYTSSQV